MKTEEYQARKQAKIDRFNELAEKNRELSKSLYNEADKMASVIPFGQPILVGHHSEQRDRNYRNRIHNKMDQSIKADDRASYYENKIENLENDNSIRSDDPEACQKLQEKIKNLEDNQDFMKRVNAEYKTTQDLTKTSLTPEMVKSISRTWEIMPYLKGKPFASYSLTNNNANIRRLKERLQILQKNVSTQTTEKNINGVRIVDNVEDNRLQLFFPSIPPEEIRTQLKQSGFRWSPFNKCWQRFRSNVANYKAETICGSISI